MKKAVFLDRDGVLNVSQVREGKAYAPRTLEDFKLFPFTRQAVQNLADAGYLIFVVTNQPDIGNGLVDPAVVEQMHEQLRRTLPIAKIYCCAHRQQDGCECRKPKPGMLLTARDEFHLDMTQSYMVGDRYSDVQAGRAAGVEPIFIDYNYIETPDFSDTIRAENLHQASLYIIEGKRL